MGKDVSKVVKEFMEGAKEKAAKSIVGKNILIVHSNKIYRNVKDIRGAYLPGYVSYVCDGVKITTNAEILILEEAI